MTPAIRFLAVLERLGIPVVTVRGNDRLVKEYVLERSATPEQIALARQAFLDFDPSVPDPPTPVDVRRTRIRELARNADELTRLLVEELLGTTN